MIARLTNTSWMAGALVIVASGCAKDEAALRLRGVFVDIAATQVARVELTLRTAGGFGPPRAEAEFAPGAFAVVEDVDADGETDFVIDLRGGDGFEFGPTFEVRLLPDDRGDQSIAITGAVFASGDVLIGAARDTVVSVLPESEERVQDVLFEAGTTAAAGPVLRARDPAGSSAAKN
jgi:hypothetical protein